MKLFNKILSLLLIFTGINTFSFAQTVFLGDIQPKTRVIDFVLPDRLTVTKTIYTSDIISRANGHIFVPGPSSGLLLTSDLVCYNTEGVQVGPIVKSNLPTPHFDNYLGDLACLVRLAKPENNKKPYAIMYTDGTIRNLPYVDCSTDGFIDGLAMVSDGREHYLIDHYGNVKAKGYDNIGPLTEERRAVEKKGKWGFLDRDCKVIVEPKYYQVGLFSDQVAWVRKDNILSEPILINQFGTELHFTNPLVGRIVEAFDFVRGEALVHVENKDGNREQKIIDKSGLPLVVRDFFGNIWLTDFDNEHAEYFFDIGQDENGFNQFCSTKGNRVNGLTSFRRGPAFSWQVNKYQKFCHYTAKECFVDINPDGDFYTEDHIVWRCNNPNEDFFFFKDEIDGIALWDYKGNTYISSSIRLSEKTELGGEFTNIVRIASPDERDPNITPSDISRGQARLPNSEGSTDTDGIGIINSGSNQNQDGSGGGGICGVSNNKILTLSKLGNGNVAMSANGTTIDSGEKIAAGTQLTVVCTPDEGGYVSIVKLNDSKLSTTVNEGVCTATFQMPSCNSTIFVEFTDGSK